MSERSWRSDPAAPDPASDALLERTLARATQLRRRRRAARGGVVALVAVAAVAVAVPLADRSTTGAGPQVRVGAPGPSRTPEHAASVAPVCQADALRASFDHSGDGALVGAQQALPAPSGVVVDTGTTLLLTNAGPTACTLPGAVPVLSAEYAGRDVRVLQDAATSEAAGPGVTLEPGTAAGTALRWNATTFCGSSPQALLIGVPGMAGRLAATWDDGAICDGYTVSAAGFSATASPRTASTGPLPNGFCSTGQLEWVFLPHGSDLSADPASFAFEAVNLGVQSCTTGDYPGVSASDQSGAPYVVVNGRAPIGGAPTRLALLPGAVASFAVELPNASGATCTTLGAFHFIAPNDTAVSSAIDVTAASGPAPRSCGTGAPVVGPLHTGVAHALAEAHLQS